MFTPPKHRTVLFLAALAILAFALVPTWSAYRCLGRTFGGLLVDPDGAVSTYGIPAWDGFQKNLTFPDRVLEVDGRPLVPGPGLPYAASVLDDAVAAARAAGRDHVHARVFIKKDQRAEDRDLTLSQLDAAAVGWIALAPIGVGLLYAAGALIALAASPRGALSRSFAKTTLFAALFLFTLFDYHTTRALVPLFHLAFAMVPMGFFVLALRLPDDVPLLHRRPWIPWALDGLGLALGLAMIGVHLAGGATLPLRMVCSGLFAASFFFFAVTFLVRFARAEGDRRATLRALFVAMVPAHVIIGAAFALGSQGSLGATGAFLALPALALTPLATVFALVRHDLWGSRALLSRVLIRGVIMGATCAFAIALGTGVAALFDVPAAGALLAASVAGVVGGLAVQPALRFGDSALFPARADYKPTIEQLSEELTLINVPEEVGHAVERTVRRWLPCESVEFVLAEGRVDVGVDETDAVSGIRVRASAPDARALVEPADHLSIDVLFRDSPLAALRVGKKRGGALFTSEDVDLLRTIANQAALALAHAYSYQELELRRRQQAAASRSALEALAETVAAEVAHEVRYPINYFRSIFVRGAGELHLDGEDVDIGCDEVERLERLVSGLRRVAHRRLERHPVRVGELVQKVERLLRDQLGGRRIEVELDGAPAIRCDPDQTTQVLVNLVSNALDAAGEEGRVGVTWRGGPDTGALTVWDTGPGFSGDPARVFTPWYTTKARGTGLGLAISHRIVRAHGWKIEPERRGDRTLFVIDLPHTDLVQSHAGGAGAEVA